MRKYFFLTFLCLKLSSSYAQQLYPIRDTAFLHYLHDSMPSVIKNDSLIIDSARVCQHDIIINFPYPNKYPFILYTVSDIDGIQFFKHINSVILSYTQIQTIPYFASDSLRILSIYGSPLHIIPPLDSLPNLLKLGFTHDSVTHLPDLSHLQNLNYLDIYGSNFDSIPPLDSLTNLEELWICYTNGHFKKLPNLSNNKKLNDLYLQYNAIDSLPRLDSCPLLQYINVSHNKLSTLPSLSNNIDLVSLICDHT